MVSFWFQLGLASAEDKNKKPDPGERVTEVKPGVKRYGSIPEFGSVGHSNNFDVSPDGETLVFAGQKLKFWDLEKMEVRDETELKGGPGIVEYSPDGLSLYCIGWEHTSQGSAIFVLDGITGETKNTIKPIDLIDDEDFEGVHVYSAPGGKTKTVRQFHAQHFCVSPDDDKLAISSGQYTLLIDAESGEKICGFKSKGWIQTMAFSPDGKYFLDGGGVIYDAETGEKSEDFSGNPLGSNLSKIVPHPKRNIVAIASWNSGLTLYDLDKKRKIELDQPETAQQFYVAEFSGNGKLLAAISRVMMPNSKAKPQIVVWDLDSKKIRTKIPVNQGHMIRMRFAADNESIYTKFSGQRGISKWSLDEDDRRGDGEPTGHESPIRRLAFSPDNKSITTIAMQGPGIVTDLDSGETRSSFECNNNASHLACSQSGKYTAVASHYQGMTIVNNKTGKSKNVQVRAYEQPSMVKRFGSWLSGDKKTAPQWENFAISDIRISEDDSRLLIASRGQRNFRMEQVELSSGKRMEQQSFKMEDYWEIKTQDDGQPIGFAHSQFQWLPRTTTIAPNEQLIAIFNDAKELVVIDAETKTLVHELGTLDGHQPKLRFSADSSKLIALGKQISIWDMESGEKNETEFSLDTNQHHFGVEISQNGERLAISNHGVIKVFELESGEEVFSENVTELAQGLGISNDGKLLAVPKQNCQFEVWDLDQLASGR